MSQPTTISLAEADARLTALGEACEIVSEEIRGVETRVWKNAPQSLRELLEGSRQHQGDFLVYEEDRLTFAEHFAAVSRLAALLRDEYGVETGDRVAIAMRNYPEWSIVFWAATAIGAIAVPLNAWWLGQELVYGLEDSGAEVLVVDPERLARVEDQLPGLALKATLVVRSHGATLAAGCERWEQALGERILSDTEDDPPSLPEVVIHPDDPATIFYTSGTTGFPKGALGTHRNICSNYATIDFLRARGELRTGVGPPEGVQLASLLSVPLFHVTGCHSTLVPALATGAKLVLVYKFDAEETLRVIEREKITSFGGVPTLVWKVLECEAFDRYDTSSVLRIGYGGAPAAPELVRRLQEEFPDATPSNGYGLTETSSITTSNAGDAYLAKPDSVGPPVPVCEVKVVGPNGSELPVGEVGELWIKGPNVIAGYWNKPEASTETITDGWLHSGDMARVDEEGFVYIVDRAKDMVIRGGENIYSVEVESAIFDYPDVIDVAVFGVPDRVLGEEVAASVQVRDGAEVTAEVLRVFLEGKLAAFKIPVHWDLTTDHFPQNANGKTMKAELKRRFLERLEGPAEKA